jgi:hypothetical protein
MSFPAHELELQVWSAGPHQLVGMSLPEHELELQVWSASPHQLVGMSLPAHELELQIWSAFCNVNQYQNKFQILRIQVFNTSIKNLPFDAKFQVSKQPCFMFVFSNISLTKIIMSEKRKTPNLPLATEAAFSFHQQVQCFQCRLLDNHTKDHRLHHHHHHHQLSGVTSPAQASAPQP